MNVVAIIPARGGSKGIPRKNLLPVAGKPLVAWSIEAARRARTVTRTLVSTDDDEIAGVARNHGAEVVMRPAEISGDTASSESALLHALDVLRGNGGPDPDVVVFLQATSPHRVPADIDGAVDLLVRGNYDSVFGGCAEHFTGRWALDADGRASPLNFDPVRRPRRQERALEYLENGSVYAFRPALLRATGSRMGGRIGIHPMPAERSHQIDGMEDVPFFEKMLSRAAPEAGDGGACLPPRLPATALIARIRLLALDFDGVLTDNRVQVDGSGGEAVVCSRADSWGITQLRKAGVHVAVISTETHPVVEARCRKLGIACVSGCGDKAAALSRMAAELGCDRLEVAFVGNDTNDAAALQWAGTPVLVGDANGSLVHSAAWVTRHPGGRGAVREVCDAILAARGAAGPGREGEGVYFVRREPAASPDYESAYWGVVRDPDGVVRDRLQERRKHLEDLDAELAFLNALPAGRILDVGCGLGFFLSGLREGWDRHGVEVSRFAAEHARTWGDIFAGTLEEAAYPAARFDAVVFHHVIEHIDEPLRTLREIRRVLRPGGWLVLGTPDFDSGCARRFGESYRLLHDPTHVSLFTCESMHRLLRDEGFAVEQVDFPYFNTRYFTKENLLRMLEPQGISPPFYGNFMTFYARKPESGEPLRPPGVRLEKSIRSSHTNQRENKP